MFLYGSLIIKLTMRWTVFPETFRPASISSPAAGRTSIDPPS